MGGTLSSMTLLAELHYNGYGTTKDIQTARRLYELAAAGGHQHAKVMVFLVSFRDRSESASCREMERGFEYLVEAADSGYEKAIELLEIVTSAGGACELASESST